MSEILGLHPRLVVEGADEALEFYVKAFGAEVLGYDPSLHASDPVYERWRIRPVALRELLESLEALQVANAREQGWSWQQIAAELGVSKQAVHKKHGRGLLRRGR